MYQSADRGCVGQKQRPALFKLTVGWTMKQLEVPAYRQAGAQALKPNIGCHCKKVIVNNI